MLQKLQKLNIQSQLVIVIVLAFLFLLIALQFAQSVQERNALVEAEQKRGEVLIGSVNATIQAVAPLIVTLDDIAELDERLQSLVTQNEDIDFIAVTWLNGAIVFHSNAAYKGQVVDALTDLPMGEAVRRDVPGFGKTYLVSTIFDNPVGGEAQFYITVGIPTSYIDASVLRGLASSVVIASFVIVLVLVVTLVILRNNITVPLKDVSQGAQSFSTGRLDHQIAVNGSREIRDLAETLNSMAGDLQQSRTELVALYEKTEMNVAERTRDLQMSAEIGRIATSLHDIDRVMQETVEQIRRRFDEIYHAQIFLVDDLGKYAVLVESTGEAGRTLIELGHKLPVGSDSVIGYVTDRGKTIMASDTLRGEVPWRPNPILPETRAEMALPLSIEGRVVGALDVQSTEPDVFTDEMVRIFEVLADQLAIAIENAQLLSESDHRLDEINDLNRQLTQSAWRDFIEDQSRQAPLGYVYDQLQIVPLDDQKEQPPGSDTNNSVAIPVRVRGEVIGSLIAELETETSLSRDDRLLVEAVAERVALAVESARLFAQTQRALAETEQLYETARTVSSAPNLETIYSLIAEQLNLLANVDHIDILISGPDPMLVQYLESAYNWQRRVSTSRTATSERVRLIPLTYDEYEVLPQDEPVIYSDIRRELAADHPLRAKLNSLHSQSALLAPLVAGRRWFGLLLCSSTRTGGFDASYRTFVSALADQLAIAIENRRLFEEAQIEARRARALAEAGQLASQIGGDFETGLTNLFDAVAGPGNYDRWWFGLLTDDRTQLRRVVTSREELPQIVQIGIDQNALAEAAQIGEIVLVNDPAGHPAVGELDDATSQVWGKHMAMPVKLAAQVVGVLLIGRALDETNLDERDIQLVATLASQVAVATQNQRLFDEAESQRENLQTIVETMPTGILVVDETGRIILSNQNLRDLLGPDMKPGAVSTPESYSIVRTGTDMVYPRAELPLTRVFATGQPVLVDDMTVVHPNGYKISMLAQAAPIVDQHGTVTAVVGAFQDITELQQLEHALQDSLRETTLLYEASRSISRAGSMDELFEVILWQSSLVSPDRTYVFLRALGGSDEDITQAMSQPADDLSRDDIRALAPLFKDEAVIINRNTVPDEMQDYFAARNVSILSSFPLGVRGDSNGWLVVGFAEGHAISTEQRRFMTTLADQSAISIENQRLFAQTQEALQETAQLYNASRVIADAQTPKDILSAFVESATSQPASHAYLYGLLGAGEASVYSSIELLALWGDNPVVEAVGERYRADEFPLWQYFTTPLITQITDRDRVQDENLKLLLHDLHMQACTVIPLQISDRTLGGILIGLEMAGMYSESDIRILEALADQAAITLENTRLYQQAQRRARQLSTSAEISRAVTSILRVEELLIQVVNLIRDSFEYDHAQIFLIDDHAQRAKLVASTGEAGRELLAKEHSLPVGSKSVIGQVTATGEPQIALDTADARVVHQPNPLLPHTRSEMALPLIARGQILGALDVQSNRSAAFTDEDAQMLASLADMVATAIDNARLFEISEQRAEEMAFLFNVTTAATASPDLNESLVQAVRTLRRTMKVSNASIYLPDETNQSMFRGAGVGTTDGSDEAPSLVDIDRGLLGWIVRHHEAVIISNVNEDPRELPIQAETLSVMAVPLTAGGSLAGVLVVESEQANAFRENNLRLLQTLSGSLAAIIQNSRLLREVQAANERLLEVDQLKTNFLAAMSHELRTPLNSIIGFSRVILKGIDGPLTDMQEQDLATIHDSGKHLLGLVNDILDQAKIEAGKMELAFGTFKLDEVIKGVMSSAVGLTRDKPIRLHTEVANDLPQVYGDEFRTRQVLLNLVSNASKFTPEGSITLSAFPIMEDDEVFVQVSVSDTGIGIAEKDMPLLFEAFQQVDNSLTRSVGGTGMGLPLAKSLTELQRGRIWVESEPGVGSTFSVTIPVNPPSVEEDAAGGSAETAAQPLAPTSTPQAPPEPTPRRTTILVLDDSVEVINLYRRYLSRVGYEVLGITQPDDMYNMLSAINPELIVLDVNTGSEAGWQALDFVREIAHIPVIVCTINPDEARALEKGAVAYLAKPLSEDQLVEIVQNVDRQYNRQRVLFVDDKPETVRAFREALETFGRYDIIDATSGQQALDVLQRPGRLDLVILDLRMPEIDGFEVLKTMRNLDRRAQVPVLVLTADEVSDDERAMLEFIDIYRKDVLDEDHLLNRVESQLGPLREND
ncbi:MAG: GAF domain-containing protein [Anaerolineae bacterium]|nr:GAF domain-containing protein [Anaerolineae bacterium]